MTRIELWLWTITNPITGKRRQTRHRMTEAEALERHGADAQKVEGSLEVREGDPTRNTAAHLAVPPEEDRPRPVTRIDIVDTSKPKR